MAENEKQEGLQLEELEALAGEFTLDDLAEFDNEFEFDVSDLESIKPVYTTKEKLKMILMNNTVCSIIKWCFAGLGLVGLVLYILAAVSSDISDALTDSVSAAVRNAFTTVSNLAPIPMLELLAIVVAVGLLAYIVFLIVKTVKAKEGLRIAGFWVQLVYVLVAVFSVGFLFYTVCYGVTTNNTKLYNAEFKETSYKPQLFTEKTLDSALIYYTDQINEVAVDGMSNIYYTASGHSRYASTGYSMEEISEAVNACFDAAAEDYSFLKGSKVTAKKLWFSPLYTAMGVGSIYSPLTSEVLINADYPEVVIPMQVARAIAKQRGITDDAEASFIAFLVCTKYADVLADTGSTYNMDYIKYAAYMDAYLEVGNITFRLSPNLHLYCTAALKESAKKDVVAYVKNLDALYGNVSKLEFTAASDKTSTTDYKVLAKLLYKDFNIRVEDNSIQLSYDSSDNPVPVKSQKYYYVRYLVAYFAEQEAGDWGSNVEDIYAEYNPEPLPNDGSGTGLDEVETPTVENAA